MTNKNIDKLPETYTVSYFNENEWSKDLSLEELKQQELINASYQSEINSEEKGYGPNPHCGACHSRPHEQLMWTLVNYSIEWDRKQLKKKIEGLEASLNLVKSQLKEAIEKSNEYKKNWGESSGDYLKEKDKAERLKNQVKKLREEVCNERGCGCGGYCV